MSTIQVQYSMVERIYQSWKSLQCEGIISIHSLHISCVVNSS